VRDCRFPNPSRVCSRPFAHSAGRKYSGNSPWRGRCAHRISKKSAPRLLLPGWCPGLVNRRARSRNHKKTHRLTGPVNRMTPLRRDQPVMHLLDRRQIYGWPLMFDRFHRVPNASLAAKSLSPCGLILIQYVLDKSKSGTYDTQCGRNSHAGRFKTHPGFRAAEPCH
jgi:hypothetical protein